MAKRRYLTKSRFVLAQECPSKLYYADHSEIYENKRIDDHFLEALAYGGFQVGALAKLYFPGGIEITARDHETALKETEMQLQKESVILYEAAFCFENTFARIDILIKKGNQIELIEVKAKSINPTEDSFFDKVAMKKNVKKIVSKWQPYLYDVAFQTYVCSNSRKDLSFSPYLMLVDKTKKASVEGLNQKFLLINEKGKNKVKIQNGALSDNLGEEILYKIDVTEIVSLIQDGRDLGDKSRETLGIRSFTDEIRFLAEQYTKGLKISADLGAKCKKCEFRTQPESVKKSGFQECWANKVKPSDINGPFVFDIWNFSKADKLIEQNKVLMRDIQEEDIEPKEDKNPGLSASQRRWIQVQYCKDSNKNPFSDKDNLKNEMNSWKFPYHFIDFETVMVAIPFNAGRRPYEQIAFQFSHHTIDAYGHIDHVGQYINDQRGFFPNFEFVRELKKQLDKDQGTIFRYAHHENTVLCQIYEQLSRSNEADRLQLMEWIKTITHATSEEENWAGSREMVDMLELLKRHYYHPMTNGSNSLKKVLPAILQESSFLQKKYQEPIYGTSNHIRSLNFEKWTWLKKDASDQVIDPYQQLPKIFDDVDLEKLEFTLTNGDELAEGGAAMTAYAMMQFSEMSDTERDRLRSALLKYCELDTLAMVMLYEHWLEVTKKLAGHKAA